MTLSGDEYSTPLPRRIWWPWDESPNRVAFSHTFNVNIETSGALAVACSGPYQAWLDGAPLTVPQANMPSWRAMHVLPLPLTAGTHRLSFEAQAAGQSQPFLLAALDWVDGESLARLATDGAWRMAADPPAGWHEDESRAEWRPAWAFDGVWAEPWGMPCNAPDDFCWLSNGWQSVTRETLTRVAGFSTGLNQAGASAGLLENFAIELRPLRPYPAYPPVIENTRRQRAWHAVREAHSRQMNAWLEPFEARAPAITFDCGAETFARVHVELRSGGPAILALSTGESIGEVNRAINRITDIFELADGETFISAPTGFRYVRLMALSAGEAPLLVEPLEVEHIRYPVEPAGAFNCSDPILNQIWDLSARTTHLCMQNEVWDGIKRDQLPWMGDLHAEALSIYHAFGDARLVRRSLAVLSELGPAPLPALETLRYPGLALTQRTESGFINDIPSYTLFWLVGMADYWRYTGDATLAAELLPAVQAVLNQVAASLDGGALWRLRGGWDFVDWAPLTPEDRETFCHLLACRAMQAGADLLEAAGQPAAPYRELHALMLDTARRLQPLIAGAPHHVSAAAILSGAFDDDTCRTLFEEGLEADLPMTMTAWHRLYDLEAAARIGQVAWGLAALRRHWGHALQLGLTSLWEVFSPEWLGVDPHAVSVVGSEYYWYGGYRTSLCHGWSGGPASWLHTAVLGVRPLANGFAHFEFNPNLGDLTWAEGTIPTPQGPIKVSLHGNQAHVSHPARLELHIGEAARQNWQIETEKRP
ncbi:MAG TPA: alpha-L-rhamnosidase C-terminal domain-containing protein [Anaerolineaceae bacterium]|nr:alpha-L-rhamnosidase C-terminal domain-containing protein [Anaerolineaceae bacterium]HPN51256.1 alpha-L-rhamnosidase C-terminal domain-containing protein [Anaerolineaceae bacterium]